MVASRRSVLIGGLAGLAANSATGAAINPAPCKTDRERQLLEDFAWLERYAADNAQLLASGTRPAVVFMGDSITERWQRTHPGFFNSRRICRGISGQTTPQMVLRMMADVIALRPRATHIMAGTNDIAGNTGPMTLEQTRDNIEAMTILAEAHEIKVLLASVPPAAAFRWNPAKRPAEPIRELNGMLRALAARHKATWIDYHAALSMPDGAIRPEFAADGVHPLAPGYNVMERVLAPALAKIERRAA